MLNKGGQRERQGGGQTDRRHTDSIQADKQIETNRQKKTKRQRLTKTKKRRKRIGRKGNIKVTQGNRTEHQYQTMKRIEQICRKVEERKGDRTKERVEDRKNKRR